MNQTNVCFELPDEAMTPEILTEEAVARLTRPDEFGTALTACQYQAATLLPTNADTLRQCAAFVLTCKAAEKFAETQRKAVVEPLNAQVKTINAVWMPIAKGFEAAWREVDGRVSRYIYAEQQKAIQAQQAEIARAAAEKAKLERQAAEARAAACAAAQAGDIQAAAKAEAKADRIELKTEMTVANVVPMPSKTLELGGVTLSAKAPKKTWSIPGWDKKEKLYGDDPRLHGIDPAWLLTYCTVDPVRLNKAFGVVPFPAPFIVVEEFGGSTARGGK